MSEKYKNLKIKELQELLQKNKLSTTGKKEELVARLVKDDDRKALESLEKEFELDDDFDESKINLDLPTDDFFALESLPLKESVLSDDEDDIDFMFIEKKPTTPVAVSPTHVTASSSTAVSPVATTIATNTADTIANQAETAGSTTTTMPRSTTVNATISSVFKFTPITYDKKAPATAMASPPVATAPSSKPKAAPVVTKPTCLPPKKLDGKAEKLRLEAERRLERSKRFGVKLDEKEMKEIRAARFGIAPTVDTTPIKPTAITTTATSTTMANANKATANSKGNGSEKKKVSTDPQQEILKKRAERFGLPEKKVAEKKEPIKAKQTNKKKTVAAIAKGSAIKKVLNGRITKANLPTHVAATKNNKPMKKNVTVNVTRNNVLNKIQKNVNMLNKEGIILQNKKDIINQRKVNMANKKAPLVNHGRVITIAPQTHKPVLATAAATTTLKRKRNEISTATLNNRRNGLVNPNANSNQRKVVIAAAPPPPPTAGNASSRSRNSNNSATRKRGPGSRQRNSNKAVTLVNTPQHQHRNKRNRQH